MPISCFDWLEALPYFNQAKLEIHGSPAVAHPRLVAIHDRAQNAITAGDTFSLMEAGRAHTTRGQWKDAAASFSKVLDQLPPGFRASSQEMFFCAEIASQPDLFKAILEIRPDDSRVWFAHGRILASKQQWQNSCEILHKTRRLLLKAEPIRPNQPMQEGPQRSPTSISHELAAVLLLAGDKAGYNELRTSLLQSELVFTDSHCR